MHRLDTYHRRGRWIGLRLILAPVMLGGAIALLYYLHHRYGAL